MSINYQPNKPRLRYLRQKDKVELEGDPSDVKWPMWVDLLLSRLPLLIVTIVLACTVPKASFIPLVFKWLLRKLSLLTLLSVIHPIKILLSG
jgi:hypothetical protein